MPSSPGLRSPEARDELSSLYSKNGPPLELVLGASLLLLMDLFDVVKSALSLNDSAPVKVWAKALLSRPKPARTFGC